MDTDICNPNLSEAILAANGCSNASSVNNSDAVPNVVINILNVIIGMISLVAVIYIIIGGIKYMSSRGEPDKLATAKKTILYAVIGLVICALSATIVNFAIGALNNSNPNQSAENIAESDEEPNVGVFRIRGTSNRIIAVDKSLTLHTINSTPPLSFTSSNPSVATVDKNGEITAKSPGKTTVTIKSSDGQEVTVNITVPKPVEADKVILSIKKATIIKGGTKTVKATVAPSNTADKTITWSSSNANVATVNQQGKITAKSPGSATITATTSNGKNATVNVTVKTTDKTIQITSRLLNDLNYFHQRQYDNKGTVLCGNIRLKGSCGISSYMAARFLLTGQKTDYIPFAREAACITRVFKPGTEGTNLHAIINGSQKTFYSKKYGIKGKSIARNVDAMISELKKGHVIIVHVVGKNIPGGNALTSGYHYATLISYRENNGGEIYVWNPNTMAEGWHNKAFIHTNTIVKAFSPSSAPWALEKN